MKLKSLLIGALLAAFGLTVHAADQGKTTTPPVKAIDMEHHFYIAEFIDFVKARKEYPVWKDGLGICYSPNAISPNDRPSTAFGLNYIKGLKNIDLMMDFDDTRIKYMDYAGISCAALSSTAGIEVLSREDAVKFARMSNDAVAAAIKRHPGRYVGTITLPTPYVDEAIKELERAVKVLGLKYWHTHANYGDHYLYEPQFEPLLAKCAELNVPFYLHPASPSCDYLTDSGSAFASAGFGFGVDTMKTAIRLITGGLFDRHPNLKMILGHMGEYFPYSIDRMNNRFGVFNGVDPELKWKHNFTYYFKNKNIFMTTSGIFDPNVIDIAIKNIGIDNIMLGTDYPYEDIKAAVDFVKNLPISQEDKEKILYKNAEKYILSPTTEKPDNGSFVHYTPEKLDAKTQAVIDGFANKPMFPNTEEVLNAAVEKVSGLPYEKYAAVHPEFSKEYNVDYIVDGNGWKTVKLTYKGEHNKNLPEANLIYLHGGGFLFGCTKQACHTCERLARQMNFTVYIPLYPLAPKYYVQTTLDMLLDLYRKVQAEDKPIYIMGDSAGGNITLTFGLYLKDKKEKLPDALFPISPFCDFSLSNPRLSEYLKKDILISMDLLHIVVKHWKPKDMSPLDPRVSPQFGNWEGMPPVFLFAGTSEAVYPEIMDTAENMRKAGVRVGMLVGHHLFHIAPLFPLPVQDQYFEEITEFLYGER